MVVDDPDRANVDPTARIHPTAILEDRVSVGADSSIWDNVHVRHGARIGHDTIVGEKSYIAYDVSVGNFVKINAKVYVCAEVTIEDGVMISAGTTFTNDVFPRSMNRELTGLERSDVTEETLATRVAQGVTIGAQATIGPGITLGQFSMIGMGAVVTRDVSPHALVIGNPARPVGYVCICGPRIVAQSDFEEAADRGDLPATGQSTTSADWICERCQRGYVKRMNLLQLHDDPYAERAMLRW